MKGLQIGIAGVGTVGSCVVRKLAEGCVAGAHITRIAARDIDRDRGFSLPDAQWTQNAPDLAEAENVDLVVELIGGADGPALDLARSALANKKHVVTANKALLAKHGMELADLAEKNDCVLAFEAAVAGGIPVVKALSEGLSANEIHKINGILNGTCNFILSEMETGGAGYEETLLLAQRLGYAEADPAFDIDGIDAAQKLSLLSAIAFALKPDENRISTKGISSVSSLDFDFAAGFDAVIRLVARAEKTDSGIVQWVGPCLIRKSGVLSRISGVTNAVRFETDMVDIMLQGPGAGGGATASAVLADIGGIVRFVESGMKKAPCVFGVPATDLAEAQATAELPPCEWYIRLTLEDEPGSMAKVTSVLAEHEVSIEEAVQRGPQNGEAHRPVVFITHECGQSTIKKALKALEAVDVIAQDVNFMPVL